MDQAARLDVHWHILFADGAWCETEKGPEFLEAPPLKQEVWRLVLKNIIPIIMGMYIL